MQRIYDPTAAASLPAPPALTGTVGYFTGGSPGTVPATRARYWFLNMIQEELLALLAAAGITPDTTATVFTQVLQAIRSLRTGRNVNVYKIIGGTQQVSVNGAAFTSTGATSFVPSYTGVGRLRASGGGGGTGAAISGGSSGGGAAGTYGEAPLTMISGTPIAVTVGAGGAAGSSSAGGNGGTTTVGSISIPGGGGSPQVTTATAGGPGTSGGDATGCYLSIAGAPGAGGGSIGGQIIAGQGGGGPLGTGGYTNTSGQDPGGGAGGTQGSVSTNGLAGAPGIVIIEY